MENPENNKKLNLLFLEYLMLSGFDDPSVKNVLEVGAKSVEESMSFILPKDRYNQFLLSKSIDPWDLNPLQNLNGEVGFITKGKPYYWLSDSKEFSQKYIIRYLDLKKFDTLLSKSLNNEKNHAIYSCKMPNAFIGECFSLEDKGTKRYLKMLTLYEISASLIKSDINVKYDLISDLDSANNIGYCLLRRMK